MERGSPSRRQTPVKIGICILAGGLSTRMGRPKQRLRLQRLSLLQHVRAAAEATGWPVRAVRRDIVDRCGPIGGIYTGLKTSCAEAEVFLACDMPFVSRELIVRLASSLGPKRAVFAVGDGLTGFPAIVRVDSVDLVHQQIAKGEFSIQMLARHLKAKALKMPASHKAETLNINTPQELAAARNDLRRPSRRRRLL